MDTKALVKQIENHRDDFKIHAAMFDILEGNLAEHLGKWLGEQLTGDSLRYALSRMAPINVLKKLIDKLSTIYQQNPKRYVLEGTPNDSELVAYYEASFKMNQKMNQANEFFNLGRATLIQPYLHDGRPKLRAVPNDRFIVYSDDLVDPLTPTVIATCHGDNWHAWSKDEFKVINQYGEVLPSEMAKVGNPDGVNPYGAIPYVYVNRSATMLIPKPDKDSLMMTLLIPGLITDLNYASMFSLFSILYGIDVDNENLKMAPSAFWSFKSDSDSDKKPQIGTIKPEADVAATLDLVKSELAMWLQSRNIKPGSVGDTEGSNFASAVSKMVDEADTTDERKKQVEYFVQAEYSLWTLITKNLHPYWTKTRQIDTVIDFSASVDIVTSFNENIPLMNRGDLIRDFRDEVDAGFTSKKRAIGKLNPELTDAEIDELMHEIEEDQTLVFDEPKAMEDNLGAAESEDSDTEELQSEPA